MKICLTMARNIFCKLTPKSILESFHPLAIFGQICGFFPIQNIVIGFASVKSFRFDLFSYPILYSIVLNFILYIISFETTWDYWLQRRNLFKFSTDAFAIQIFLAVYLFLRFTLHILCICRAPKVLECLKQLETYDSYYKFQNRTTLLNRYMGIYLVGTGVNIVGNISASYMEVMRTIYENVEDEGKTRSKYLIFYIIPHPDVLSIVVYGIHVFAEAALFFSHCCITYIITGICDRVDVIKQEVQSIALKGELSVMKPYFTEEKTEPESMSVALWINQINLIPFVQEELETEHGNKKIYEQVKFNEDYQNTNIDQGKKLKILCSQYLALVDISKLLNAFAKETMAVFTAGSAVMLVALFYLISILLTQYVPMSSNRIKESSEIIPIVFIAVITFLRLLNFINIGEKMRCDGIELAAAIDRLYSSHTDSAAVIGYFQHVATKLSLSLSAGGFFVVRRTVITSILGPIVTFIVILAQFRAADLQLHYSTNATRLEN